jgi:hypothetical protein
MIDPRVVDYLDRVRRTVPYAMPRPGRDLPEARLRGEEVMQKLSALGVPA